MGVGGGGGALKEAHRKRGIISRASQKRSISSCSEKHTQNPVNHGRRDDTREEETGYL